jgi:hypothetical protein
MAIAHLGDVIEDIAPLAPEYLKVRPHLPVDLSPWDPVGLPNKGNELFEVPGPVDDMLGPNLSVIIDVWFALGAVKDLPLAHSEKLVAECTLVEVVTLLLEQKLQFFHEKPRH